MSGWGERAHRGTVRRGGPYALALAGLLSWLPATPQAEAATPPPSRPSAVCSARVAVLGIDMSAGGRFEVQGALKVGSHTIQVEQTVAQEKVLAHGLIPTSLLGDQAVSSALLHPLAAGSGLTITLNSAISLNTARSYANALLTAGITDAEVGVAAPTSQPALGTSAWLGLLRAAQMTCFTLSPQRIDLSIRELVLSETLARDIGHNEAPTLIAALKLQAAHSQALTTDALATVLDRVSTNLQLLVPESLRHTMITYLHDFVASGAFTHISTVSVANESLRHLQAHVVLAPVQQQSRAGLWQGTLLSLGAGTLTARLRGGTTIFPLASAYNVTRNKKQSSLTLLRAGDSVSVQTNATGQAVAIMATGSSAPLVAPTASISPQGGRSASGPAHATGSSTATSLALVNTFNMVGTTVLAIFVLLALLTLPLIVTLVRRRTDMLAPAAPPLRPAIPRPVIFIPKGIDRAPFKRRPARRTSRPPRR